jgi:DNA-binding transcriptional LysR family regulator
MRALRDHLAAAGLEWPTAIEVTELDLVAVYVRGGFGIGLGVGVPGERPARGVRRVAIPEIPPLRLGAMWHGEATDIMLALTDALRRRALTSSVWVLSNTKATP